MVYVTIDTDENANKLIQAVLEANQVACVNKIKQGMFSSYKWEGKVVVDEPRLHQLGQEWDQSDWEKRLN